VELEPRHIQALELHGAYWLNAGPVSIRAMAGRVVLLDFWDYSCVNCIRALDYIRDWSRKYDSYGLVTVGVHTPEFRFGHDPDVLAKAVVHAGIKYPVVADNDAIVWSAYAVRAWPTRILIDRDGFVRYVQHGERGYGEFERALQQLLSEAGYRGEFPPLTEPVREEDYPGSVCYRQTGELYFGYLRGTIGNPEGFNPESTVEYEDPGYYVPERFYAIGKWFNGRESLRYDGGENARGIIILQYEGRSVHAVMTSRSGQPCEIQIRQDDVPVKLERSGSDPARKKDGMLTVDEPRMYTLVRNQAYGAHTLQILTSNSDLEIFTASFTTSVIPDIISRN